MNDVAYFMGGASSLLFYWCDGCDMRHMVHTQPVPNEPGLPVWEFNGNLEKPTISPSVLVNWKGSSNPKLDAIGTCHTFITDGVVEFLADCGHILAGQKVPLRKVSEWREQ